MKKLLCCTLWALLVSAPPLTADCIDYGQTLHWSGGAATQDLARAVAVDGPLACVALGASGLATVDVSEPTAPGVLGTVDLPGVAVAAALRDRIACVALYDDGIAVVDVADPQQPVMAGYLRTPGVAHDVVLTDKYALVAAGTAGLLIVDISQPSAPVLVGQVAHDGGQAFSVALADNAYLAYVAYDDAGIVVFDYTDPGAPWEVYNLWTNGQVHHVAASGSRLAFDLLAFSAMEVQFAYLVPPAYPEVRSSVPVYEEVRDIAARDDVFLVGVGRDGLLAVSTSDLSQPRLLTTPSALTGDVYGVAADAKLIVLASMSGGVQLLVGDPTFAPPIEFAGTPPTVRCIDAVTFDDRTLACTGSMSSGLYVWDVGNGQILGSVETPGSITDVALRPWTAVVTDNEAGLLVVDLGPGPGADPTIVGTLPMNTGPQAVARRGDLACVATYSHGLAVISLADPEQPALLTTVPLPGIGHDVVMTAEGLAWAAMGDAGLQVVDLTQPADPVVLASLDSGGEARGVTVAGEHAYIADGPGGLVIVDATDPAHPQVTAVQPLAGNAWHVALQGVIAYIACGDDDDQALDRGTVVAVDVSDPTAPELVGAVDLGSQCRDLAVTAMTSICAAATVSGLGFLPHHCGDVVAVEPGGGGEGEPVPSPRRRPLVSVHPNPANPRVVVRFTCARPGPAAVAVFDPSGRCVADLWRGTLAGGEHTLTWDGRDTAGRRVASGTYVVRLRTADRVATCKVTLAR